MSSPALPSPRAREGVRSEATRDHIRGSNLLLFGRLLSLGTNFLAGVLTVRYLAKGEYGALQYALSIATTAANAILLGMPRSVLRFAAIYEERRDYPKMYGSLALATGVIVLIGVLGTGLFYLMPEPVLGRWVKDPLALSLLLLLITLAPLQALDNLFQAMLAVFAGPAAIFFRRYILGPLLRLGAVALVIAFGGSVRFLAWAYLVTAVIGIAIYGPMLRRSLTKSGLWQRLDLSVLRLPVREVLSYGLPLVLSDLLVVVRPTLAIVVLEYLASTTDVADFTAFLKIASLNLIVLQSMKLLYLPVASRLYSRGDHAAIDDLYWQTTVWISLITFPIFVPCITMPETVALIVNGEKYVGASQLLVVLALGEYFNAATGLNTYTLQVYARVRFLVWTMVLATAVGLVLNMALIPLWGAMGAAVATAGGLVLQNLLHHWGLHRASEVELFRWKYLRVYLDIALAMLALVAVDQTLQPPVIVEALLVAAASLALLRLHRDTMDLGHVFPELGSLPLLGRLLGFRRPRPSP